jgi:tRNA-splicing ligase RtcB
MKKVFDTEKIPVKLWLEDIEEGAMVQVKNIANLPFAFHHVAIMPDCHQGYGMPIGGVLATKDVVIPNAVGVDIGCGMCAMKTSLKEINPVQLKGIMSRVREKIPLGFKHHKKGKAPDMMPLMDNKVKNGIVEREFGGALKQIGTLGGGNHFIEIQAGNDGHIWIMVHSGSRNIGLKVAEYYNKKAKILNEKWHSKIPSSWQLDFLPIDSIEGQDYLAEMQYCVDFAFASRKLMMENIVTSFHETINGPFEEMQFINIAHNYARMENHFGKSVMVHRKGATSARKGEIGIIPGSQGTRSYIVLGKGNPDSFQSCSHGAGRILSRKKARVNLDLKSEIARLDKEGIIHSIRHARDLDEAPGAYKNINEVMENQKDLVDILVELSPLAVIKG